MRPVLRPGVRVLRRDLYTLQAGLDWPGLTTMEDSPGVRAVLALMDGVRTTGAVIDLAAARVDRAQAIRALESLMTAGLVVDQAATVRPLDGSSDPEWAALWLLNTDPAAAVAAANSRRQTRIGIRGHGLVGSAVRQALVAARLNVVSQRPDLSVIVSDQEPRRELSDAAMRSDRPHLWAYVRDTSGILGPFVVPGATPCMRCVDRSKMRFDRCWPTLTLAASRPWPQPPACDPPLAGLVGAWAAHEICMWAAGATPLTLGSTLEIPQAGGAPQPRRYELHPECGCGWPPTRATIGA